MVTADVKDGAPKKLIKFNNKLPWSVISVLSSYDILIEILLRLPVLSLVLFKSVSKHWLSLINDANFIMRRGQMPNLNPVSGMFLKFYPSKSSILCTYDFVPFDICISVCRSLLLATTFTFGPEGHGDHEILQSCNGLLLCRHHLLLYVYNPSLTNMFKVIPKLYSL